MSTCCNKRPSNLDAITHGNLKTEISVMMIIFNNLGFASEITGSSCEPTVSNVRISIIREEKLAFFSYRLGEFLASRACSEFILAPHETCGDQLEYRSQQQVEVRDPFRLPGVSNKMFYPGPGSGRQSLASWNRP